VRHRIDASDSTTEHAEGEDRMPSEREDSIRKGIHPPQESAAAQEAAREKRARTGDAPGSGGGMGGSSDADTPGEEALFEAQRRGSTGSSEGSGADAPPPHGRSLEARSTVPLRTGRDMPVIGLGTWELTDDTAGAVEHALARGYRMIDTAVDYGSQSGIGEALRRTDVPRREIFLVAKVEEDEDALEATERYLGEMRQEYANLMLIHRPPPEGAGVELWNGLIRAREEGLATDIGVSNYTLAQIDALVNATGETPVVNQIEWTPFGWSPEMLDGCRERGIVIQGYSPLTRARRLDDERLSALAEKHGRTPAQLLLRWSLQQGVVPLPKANRGEHMEENLGAFDFQLADADMGALDELNEQYSALGASPQYL
jgi:2,5-diketo-D-gluconate reductase A